VSTSLGGYMGRVLKIDLTARTVEEYPWTDDQRRLYLGGKVMAARILADTLADGTDPLGPENVVVVATGPLTGTGAPSTARFDVSALSPLTGIVASSNCGGPFGTYLKKAVVDALVITGRAAAPTHLEIADGEVTFADAGDLWGMRTSEVQEALAARLPAKAGALVIGPAGENLVRYAALFSGERAAGRAGLGAVFGSKNLKAITSRGGARPRIAEPDAFKRHNQKWTATLKAHPLTGEMLPTYGTAGLVRPMQRLGILATKNYKSGRFDEHDALSGETMAATRLVATNGCLSCPIRCARVVEHEGKRVKGPELETLVLLGSNLQNASLDRIIELNVALDELGMDTMSFGGTVGFAMELQERGLADLGVRFGDTDSLAALIDDIAHRRGAGDELADGSRALAAKYGALDCAPQVKGMELAAYEPRGAWGHALGYATSNRGGCHLNGGYAVALEGLGLHMKGRSTASKPALTAMFQDLMEAVSAAGSCLFTTYAVLPAPLVRGADRAPGKIANAVLSVSGGALRLMRSLPAGLLAIPMPLVPHIRAVELATGMRLGFGPFWTVGVRGFNLEREINRRFGVTAAADTLPSRFTDEPMDAGDAKSVVPMNELKPRYYRHRGWDADGAPRAGLLRKLGLASHDTEGPPGRA
jgi:aldehyde:ferredoxin oxidoreductase